MSFFSFLTGGAKQSQKMRLRSEEARLGQGKAKLEQIQRLHQAMVSRLQIHKALTAEILKPRIRRVARNIDLPRSSFSASGRFSHFSDSETAKKLSQASAVLRRALSGADRVALGVFGTGVALKTAAMLDELGILNIPDWHRPLSELISAANLPGGDLILGAAAEVGADTLLDVIGDITIVLGIAKGVWNLFKTAEFADKADTVAAAVRHLDDKIAAEHAGTEDLKRHGQEYDEQAYALFKQAVILDVLCSKARRSSRGTKVKLSSNFSDSLADFCRLHSQHIAFVS